MLHLRNQLGRLCLTVAAMTMAWSSAAQDLKLLSVEETTEGIGVYPCEDRHEALVVFICRESFGLTFESNFDRSLEVKVDTVPGERRYSIVLLTQAPGVSYEGRRLKIFADGFRPYTLPLALRDKQKIEYTVSDPYSVLRSPYFVYLEKANDLFYKGEYQGAKDDYELARACPEYAANQETVDGHIALCDSMITWGAQAVEMEHFAQYYDAYRLYVKMMQNNSSNEQLRELASRAIQNFHSDCDAQFQLGEHYQEGGDWDKARTAYERVIAQNCTRGSEATEKLSEVRKAKSRQEGHARTLFYDFGKNLPIGFTYAICLPDHAGGYFTLRFNPNLINLMAGKSYATGEYDAANNFIYDAADYELPAPTVDAETLNDLKYSPIVPKELAHEMSVSLGRTYHIWEPFYWAWGVGYHGGGYNVAKLYSDLKSKQTDHLANLGGYNNLAKSDRNKCSKATWASAPLVEASLILKYWRINAKFTYQFNYWLGYDDEVPGLDEFFEDQRHRFYFALGFCW